ncbi:hypothetical protein Hanom_Chr07g00598231 [Helianthus anomalus]
MRDHLYILLWVVFKIFLTHLYPSLNSTETFYASPSLSLSILFTNKTQTKSHSSLKLYTHFHRPNTLSVTPPTRQKAGGQRPVEPFATTVVIGGVWTVERRCDYGGAGSVGNPSFLFFHFGFCYFLQI